MPAKVIGLTGGIASGKSTVAGVFIRKKIPVISADFLAREVVSPGSPGLLAVSRAFPGTILSDGTLDRSALAKVIFSNPMARKQLESILHPLIRGLFREQWMALSSGHPVVVYEVPLLFESGADRDVDFSVVVDVPGELQKTRLMKRDGLSEEEADARIRSQLSREDRKAKADRIINGWLSGEELDKQVEEIVVEVARRPPRSPLPF